MAMVLTHPNVETVMNKATRLALKNNWRTNIHVIYVRQIANVFVKHKYSAIDSRTFNGLSLKHLFYPIAVFKIKFKTKPKYHAAD